MELEAGKQVLIDWLQNTHDECILTEVEMLKKISEGSKDVTWEDLGQEQRDGIDQAIASLDGGEGRTEEEARMRIKGKLGIDLDGPPLGMG